jgi:hypothetical protein
MSQVAHEDIPEIVVPFFREAFAKSHGGLLHGPMSALLLPLSKIGGASAHLLSTRPIVFYYRPVQPCHCEVFVPRLGSNSPVP